MDSNEVDAVVAALRAGRSYRVPFTTTLYPDTRADTNVLRALPDGFELTTTYCEFAPGHGWSLEMKEIEVRTEAEVRASLGYARREEVEPCP